MKDPIKITEEELTSALSIQTDSQNSLIQFGSLYVEKLQIDNAIKVVTEKENELQKQWKSLQEKENTLIQKIYEKYGNGQLDLKKGLFIPDESK